MKAICNSNHLNQITHIDLITSSLVCPNDIPIYKSFGANLVPVMEFAYDYSNQLKKLSEDAQSIITKLTNSLSLITLSNPLFDQIEIAFKAYINYIISIKNQLITKLRTPPFQPNN